MGEFDNREREEIFSKPVRAGKRTYFFDVKATKAKEYYITITESKKKFQDDGTPFYEKHKLFLYKEDFEKFFEGLKETVEFVSANQGVVSAPEQSPANAAGSDHSFTDLDFDQLGKKE